MDSDVAHPGLSRRRGSDQGGIISYEVLSDTEKRKTKRECIRGRNRKWRIR
jgi:hypothetical protein